jgi:hypothetical protein
MGRATSHRAVAPSCACRPISVAFVGLIVCSHCGAVLRPSTKLKPREPPR